jgi:hypothetical protein
MGFVNLSYKAPGTSKKLHPQAPADTAFSGAMQSILHGLPVVLPTAWPNASSTVYYFIMGILPADQIGPLTLSKSASCVILSPLKCFSLM